MVQLPDFKTARLLIVDDTPDNVHLLEMMLRAAGYENLQSATAPRDAIRLFQESTPDLVLLDLLMPEMSGFDLLDHFRQVTDAAEYLPVLVLTGMSSQEARQQALEQGAQDFLTRPFDRSEVLVRIENLLHTRFLQRHLREKNQLLEEKVREAAVHQREAQNALAALRQSQERLELVLRGANDGIWDWNMVTDEVYFSPYWKAMLGYSEEEISNNFEAWRTLVHPDDLQRVLATIDDYVSGRTPVYHLEYRLRQKDGGYRWILARGSVIRDAAGQPCRMAGTHFDLTERKEAEARINELNATLERRVAQRTAQLELANHELEAFSYSVSHDLRAPLRAISGFTRILLDEHQHELSPTAQEYLQLVGASSHRMGELVDDLLAFAHLSRQTLRRERIAPAGLVRAALDELRAETSQRRLDVSIGNLPLCQGDPQLLQRVWINLIANAIKFTRTRAVGIIEIGSCEARTSAYNGAGGANGAAGSGDLIYFVKDNGVGFDMKYAGKLFGVFQRLHRIEEFEGTGVGLAIVQSIIERHGGRIWVNALAGQGATFYFSLPPADPETSEVSNHETAGCEAAREM